VTDGARRTEWDDDYRQPGYQRPAGGPPTGPHDPTGPQQPAGSDPYPTGGYGPETGPYGMAGPSTGPYDPEAEGYDYPERDPYRAGPAWAPAGPQTGAGGPEPPRPSGVGPRDGGPPTGTSVRKALVPPVGTGSQRGRPAAEDPLSRTVPRFSDTGRHATHSRHTADRATGGRSDRLNRHDQPGRPDRADRPDRPDRPSRPGRPGPPEQPGPTSRSMPGGRGPGAASGGGPPTGGGTAVRGTGARPRFGADRSDPDHSVVDRSRPGRTGPSRPIGDRDRPGPERFGVDRRDVPRRTGAALAGSGSVDFPDDEDDDAGREGDPGAMSFARRVGVALMVLAVALGVGVGAGVVWEKVRPSGRTATNAATEPSPSASAPAGDGGATGAKPGATTPPAGGQAQSQVAVPADWAAYTDDVQKARFSHPPVWKQRRDNTGIFYGEPGTVSEYGPQMIGVARVSGVDATTALTQVQAGEFDGVPGLTKERSGPATDTNGQPTQELAGSYDREGARVSYLMRTVEASGAVYVLIARVPTNAAATLNTLMGALRSSFAPA
jgi:hypothetical protein